MYAFPNHLTGCTSENCHSPQLFGPIACSYSGFPQIVGCTADNPEVTFTGCISNNQLHTIAFIRMDILNVKLCLLKRNFTQVQ